MTPRSDKHNSEVPAAVPVARRGRLSGIVRAVQVRLRFVIVLALAFLVVGNWGVVRTYWKAAWHRLAGRGSALPGVSDDTEFFCPMDPGVLSDWPAICPVCNMDLVRRKKGEAVVLPEGVVARMQLSPYRIQLAGIRTSSIAPRPLARELRLGGRILEDSTSAPPRLVLECDAFDSDLMLLTPGRPAAIDAEGSSAGPALAATVVESPRSLVAGGGGPVVWFELPASGPLRAGRFAVARVSIPLTEIEPFRARVREARSAYEQGWPAVPESAVVHSGGRQIVYVETMPGMFDGVEVQLGPRCGDFYPVLAGVDPGQKVATVGAFLIDADARLNPSLAAGYFGANRSGRAAVEGEALPLDALDAGKRVPRVASKHGGAKLSKADLALVAQQKICPVTELPLDSMGGPIPVDVAGRRVFICCKGCEASLKKEPEKYLGRIPAAR